MEKNADDNDLADHPTNPHHGKNADSNGLIDPFDTASIFYLLIVLQKILIITLKIKKKTCWHDNDKKYFINIIICGLFY